MYQLKFILSLNEISAPYKFTILYITNSQSIIFFGFLCAIVYGHKIFPMTQPSLLGSTNSNLGENSQVYCISKKDEREEVEKKLSNEYEPLLYPNDYESSICTFSFSMHIFSQQTHFFFQQTHFYSICTFLFNRHIFIHQATFQSIGIFSFNKHL